jgi:hypothetical protein
METRRHGRYEAAACRECGLVEWFEAGRPVVADVALAALFGNFDLVGRLDAVSAPGREVLLYRPTPGGRRALDILPAHHWVEIAPALHASHDGSHLLLSPTDPVLVDNLTTGA